MKLKTGVLIPEVEFKRKKLEQEQRKLREDILDKGKNLELNNEILINDHFEDYIRDWGHYFYVVVGGYGSSKSYNTALKLILKCLEEKRKVLVIREVFDTHKDSTFSLFQDIIESNPDITPYARCIQSPLKIRFKNGSSIIFKGMDKPQKLKSIHNVSIVWIEEASEVKYEGFKELVGRLRHPTQSLHMILTSNPVDKGIWLYRRFFIDSSDPDNEIVTLDDDELYIKRIIRQGKTYYHHSLCDDNYFLPDSYIEQLEDLKNYDPDLYRIAREGRFGTNGVKVFPQFTIAPRSQVEEAISKIRFADKLERYGMDFGFVTSYNALIGLVVDMRNLILYITDCYYSRDKTDKEIAKDIEAYKNVNIKADCAEPKAIRYYQYEGFNMSKCRKFKGSRSVYTKKVKRFKKIVCCSDLKPVIKELKDLTFKVDNQGLIVEDEFNRDPHTLSAIWYALDTYEVQDLKKYA